MIPTLAYCLIGLLFAGVVLVALRIAVQFLSLFFGRQP